MGLNDKMRPTVWCVVSEGHSFLQKGLEPHSLGLRRWAMLAGNGCVLLFYLPLLSPDYHGIIK